MIVLGVSELDQWKRKRRLLEAFDCVLNSKTSWVITLLRVASDEERFSYERLR